MSIFLEQLLEDKTYSCHESDIQNFWKRFNAYDKLKEKHCDHELFRFVDGPPFVSGTLHYGHLLQSFAKNTVLQYQHMNNKLSNNKLGYDCHGLPVEFKINKELNLHTRPEIFEYGIDNYNKKCKEFVQSCSRSWEPIFERIGRICDFSNSYKTLDTSFMESEWWVFKQLWEKGLIYKSYKIMPFSTACETPLSNFEASDNYKEINTKSVYVCFKVKNQENTFLMAWTTTPWTLPSNLSLCVNPEAEYVKVCDENNKKFIVSKDCVANLKLKIKNTENLGQGKNLFGLEYEPLFNYMNRDKYMVIMDKFVEGSSKIGTGIVHCFIPETKVLMADHTVKEIQDIKIGDKVWGDDGTTRTVINLIPKTKGTIYKITQNRADSYYVNEHHILVLKASGVTPHLMGTNKETACWWTKCTLQNCTKCTPIYDPKKNEILIKHCGGIRKQSKIFKSQIEARDYLDNLNNGSIDPNIVKNDDVFEITVKEYINMCYNEAKTRLKGFKSKKPIQQDNKKLLIPPYLLGLWLGDGCTGNVRITGTDPEIEKYLEEYAKKMDMEITKDIKFKDSDNGIIKRNLDCINWIISNKKGNYNKNKFCYALEELNIINDKHIPQIYLDSSEKDRYELLAGLIDTDGCLEYSNCYCYSFDQSGKSKKLLDQIKTLAESLGLNIGNIEIQKKQANRFGKQTYSDGKECHNQYKMRIYGKNIVNIPCLIPRNQIKDTDCKFYNHYSLIDVQIDNTKNEFMAITVDGNGRFLLEDCTVVHNCAPSFGNEDYEACVKHKIIEPQEVGKYCPVDDRGKYTSQVKDFEGLYVFHANDEIIKNLKQKGLHFRTESYNHNYPFCYRTDTPLMYKAVSSYFVKTTTLKENMLKNNEKINWHPKAAGERHRQWLENIQDWGISRQRFFGTPIPVWVSDDGEEQVVVGSIDELVELANLKERPNDLHKEFVDKILIPSSTGKGMLKNCGEVLDCWFDSACVPYGQIHYPFDNKHVLDGQEYLSDFVCEGQDQIRNWFYVLNVISTALFNKPAFKDVICTGIIYDEHGVKFSKKYGNFKDPFELLEKYGADTIRLYLLNSPLINSNPLYFNEKFIGETKQKLIPYINAVKFFITQYTDFKTKNYEFNIDSYKNSTVLTDKWIISRLGTSIKYIQDKMNLYQIDKCIQELLDFIEDLTNWYIKFNRERLRGLAGKEEWNNSLSTLYHVLNNFIKVMTPFTPFLSEYLYKSLSKLDVNKCNSVLLCEYPPVIKFIFNEQIECQMKRLKQIVRLVRILRDKTENLKTIRIPVKKIIVYHNDKNYLNDIKTIEDLAQEEMNCENFEYENFSDNVDYVLVANSKSLGLKYKSKANLIKQNLNKVNTYDIVKFANNEIDTLELNLQNETFILTKEDLQIQVNSKVSESKFISCTERDVMVSIDTTYDIKSHNNYQIRLMLREVQKLRRASGLNPWNKINVHFKSENNLCHELFLENKDSFENKLKCSVTIDSLPLDNIFAQTEYLWEGFDAKEFRIVMTIILE